MKVHEIRPSVSLRAQHSGAIALILLLLFPVGGCQPDPAAPEAKQVTSETSLPVEPKTRSIEPSKDQNQADGQRAPNQASKVDGPSGRR